MASPIPDPLANQRKIRKGTRSCWECKRRKIRCIFPAAGEATCISCQRRRTPCVGQDVPEPLAKNGNGGLRDRISRVEDAMKDFLASNDHGDKELQRKGLPTPAETVEEYSLQPALPASESPVDLDPSEAETTASHLLWAAFPADHDVRILFQESFRTSRYILLVNTLPHGHLTHETLEAPYLPEEYIGPNTHPVILAKRMLIFAVTLQSPCEEFLNLSESPEVLSRRLVTAAVTSLTTQDETHSSVESLICILLEAVFETNCGNLRKAWITYRRAMTIAQTMGLHRSPVPPLTRIDPKLDADPEFIWFRIVYMDRYLSLLLGLPQGTSDKSMGSVTALRHETSLGQFERQLTVIASSILERDCRTFTASEIATTQSIDAELLRVSQNMPTRFWRPANFQNVSVGSPDNLLETIRLAAQVYYYGLIIQLHLPYMIHGVSNNAEREYSKITCVNASREIIRRFIAHRSFQPKSSCSRPVDFFALLAAMTLSLAHLEAHAHPRATNFLAHQRLSDRAALDQALERMEVIRDLKKDVVMEDSAKLIRQLLEIEAEAAKRGGGRSRHDAANTNVRGDEDNTQNSAARTHGELHLHIPYLGTIKITRQGLISREPLQESLAPSSAPSQTPPPRTELLYIEPTTATMLNNDTFASVPHASCTDVLQSHLDLPTVDNAAGFDDWAFQGVDMAFFDSLMRGCSSID